MLLIPYRLETIFTRIPYSNYFFIIITILIYFSPLESITETPYDFVLHDWSLSGLIGSIFLHGGIFHLLGNMLFLWVFGNAICASIGNLAYPFLYLCLGIFAGVVHLSADANPAVGASGAINGIVGMCAVLFPRNKLHCWYFFAIPFMWLFKAGRLALSTYWIVLLWLIFDILGSMGSPDGIAHWAHIGGLAGGIIIGIAGLKFKLIETPHHSIFDVLSGRSEEEDRIRTTELEQQVGLESPILPFTSSEDADIMARFGTSLVTEVKESVKTSPPIAVQKPIEAPKQKLPTNTPPDIQLKKCVGNETTLTLYIINNGGIMKSPKLRVPKEVKAQMSFASLLRNGETGWIRFSTEGIAIDSIEFIIAYTDSSQQERKIRFRCIPATSTLEVVSTS